MSICLGEKYNLQISLHQLLWSSVLKAVTLAVGVKFSNQPAN